jgi:hypothetical protein
MMVCFSIFTLLYHDIFFEPTFSFYLCDKVGIIISKIHYKCIIFFKFIQILKYDSHWILLQHG